MLLLQCFWLIIMEEKSFVGNFVGAASQNICHNGNNNGKRQGRLVIA